MKLLLESWRNYLNEGIDPEIIRKIAKDVEMPILKMYVYGSAAMSPDERGAHGYPEGHEPSDTDIWVQLADDYTPESMDVIHDGWEKSEQFEELQQMGYDVRLASKSEAVDEPNTLLTKGLL